jgi:allophanate hydrolase subunit 2
VTDGAVDPPIVHPVPADLTLNVRPGPRLEWFADDAIDVLCAGPYTVLMESNRVALRLHGPAPARRRDDELPPEGLVRGAIQVPPDGRPVLFLADHPVTGGYPVLAVVDEEDQWLAAQARPGRPISFRAPA